MTDRRRGPAKTGYGNNWVILAVVVRLPFTARPTGVPVMAKLVIKGTNSKSRLWLARRMAERLAAALPGRRVHVAADSAYAGGELKGYWPGSPGPPGCGRMPPCTALPRSGPGSEGGSASRETGSPPRRNSPLPRSSRRSP